MKVANSVDNPKLTELEADLAKALPGLLPSLKVLQTQRQVKLGPVVADLVVQVQTPQGRRRRLFIDVKATPVPTRVREALRALKQSLRGKPNGYPVLASSFLSKRVREICREEQAGFVDLAGNCWLQFENLYVEKIVDKNPFPRRGRPPSLFTAVSSRILRALLEEPQRTWQVGELAKATQVSLGQASNVCRRLVEEAYAEKSERRLRLSQPGKLLEAWREQYQMSRNTQTASYSFERDPQRLMAAVAEAAKAQGWRYAITSFAAASLVAPFVRGIGAVAWYIADATALEAWTRALDLRPAEAGPNAVLLVPYDAGVFYRTQTLDGVTLVGNVQLYLDLYSDPARGREQAEFLRKEKLKF